jgi:hypothetical protein
MTKTLALGCTLLIPLSTLAQDHLLALTENGSNLSATYDGTPLTVNTFVFSRTDWDVILGFQIQNFQGVDFQDPDGNGYDSIGNPVTSNDVSVGSDQVLFFGTRGSKPTIGDDPRDGIAIQATFTDLGDQRSVPESQSTAPILLLSFLGVLVAPITKIRAEII